MTPDEKKQFAAVSIATFFAAFPLLFLIAGRLGLASVQGGQGFVPVLVFDLLLAVAAGYACSRSRKAAISVPLALVALVAFYILQLAWVTLRNR